MRKGNSLISILVFTRKRHLSFMGWEGITSSVSKRTCKFTSAYYKNIVKYFFRIKGRNIVICSFLHKAQDGSAYPSTGK